MAARGMPATTWHAALRAASAWRLLLLWVVALLVPTAVASLPLWRALGGLLDHSVHAAAWARGFDGLAFIDTVTALAPHAPALGAGALVALVLTIALLPLLNGMIVGSALAGRTLGFGHLLQCGIVEYGCMARLLGVSIVVYALAALPVVGAFALAAGVARDAVREASTDQAFAAATAVLVLCFLLAQVVVESARAAFMADAALRSATRALGRGLRLLARRPLPTVGWFLGATLAGFLAALILALVRSALPRGGWAAFAVAFLLAQLIVLALGWAHVARLFLLRRVLRGSPPPAAAPTRVAAPADGD